MSFRRGVILAPTAVMLAGWAVLAAGSLQTSQSSVDVVVALSAGRTDQELVGAAEAAAAESTQSGDRRREATALELLGQVRAARGEYDQAEQAQQRAIAILSDLGDVAGQTLLLEQLADSQLRRRVDLDVAAGTIDQLRALRAPSQTQDQRGFARVLEFDATLQTRRGQYAAARETLTRIAVTVDPAGLSPERRAALAYLSGDVAYLMGDMNRAADDWESALDLARRAFGPDHSAVITYLGRAATAKHGKGEVGSARDMRMQAVAMAQASLPSCHPDAIAARNDLANSDEFFGDYAGARRLLEDALASTRKCFGLSHPATAQALGNIGFVLSELGDLPGAEAMQREALAAWIAARGSSHVMVARALEELGEVVARAGRPNEALDLFQRALTIRVQSLGENHPLVAQLLAARAKVFTGQRRYSVALRDLDRAAAIYARQGTLDEPEPVTQANVQLQRGDVHRALGHLDLAREAYASVVALRETAFGSSHPRVAEGRALLARIDAERGAFGEAFSEAVNAESMTRDHMRRTVRYLSERQALDYVSLRPQSLDLAIALAGGADEQRAAFDALIRSRGLVLDELAARAQAGHDDPAVAADVMKRFIAARQRYANLTVQSLREAVPRDRLDAARGEAEAAERLVAEQSVAARTERAQADAGIDQVVAALPPRAALVAFVRYQEPATTPRPSAARYGAFVVDADRRSLTFVKVGSAARVDALVASWRGEASRRSGTGMVAAGVALRRAVWDPVAAVSGNASRVFIVADGALSLVSFAALPRATSGYLVEDDRVLHELSTERDLIVSADSARSSSALIVGGPAFAGNRPVTQTAMRDGIDCRGARPLAFTELPGARVEAREVSSLWAQTGSQDAVVLSGVDATETAVKGALSHRRVVHLATHGFFFGDGCDRRAAGARAVGGVVGANAPAALVRNPLSLSGLAFAGANRNVPGAADDGILTAEEIASLDLSGTEWAVLSACDTGLGQIRSGEGVLGLRRAFQIAGARTVIMSLWSVDDQATRLWMQALYEARLTRRLDTADAVRAASIAILTQRRAARLSTHPFYWAAFVAAGDYR